MKFVKFMLLVQMSIMYQHQFIKINKVPRTILLLEHLYQNSKENCYQLHLNLEAQNSQPLQKAKKQVFTQTKQRHS